MASPYTSTALLPALAAGLADGRLRVVDLTQTDRKSVV